MIELLAAVALCTSPQLVPTLELQGATGGLRGGLLVHNRGRACLLAPASATIERPGSGTDVWWSSLSPLLVPHGRNAWIPIVWRNWCGTRPARFSFKFRGGAVLELHPTVAPRCDAPGQTTDLRIRRPTLR